MNSRGPRTGAGRRSFPSAAHRFVWGSLVFAAAAAAWALVRWTSSLLLPGFAIGLSSFARELASFVAGLIAFVSIIGLIVHRLGAKWHRDPFADLTAALRRIARGDFDVSMQVDERRSRHLGGVADEVNEMARSLKRLEEFRQEFVSTVSHDIQSPLTSIIGFAQALRSEHLTVEERNHYLTIIEEESRRLSRLSGDLLSLTALEARPLLIGEAHFALDAHLRSVVLSAEPQWRARDLRLELDLPRVQIRGDKDMLAQAWTNLLHNACKFSPLGARVSIGLQEVDGQAIVRFEDEGVGIEPGDLPFLFDRFFKADRSRSRAVPGSGSGLGLAIVKKIVELHGGQTHAESRGLGTGAVFTVALPVGGPLRLAAHAE